MSYERLTERQDDGTVKYLGGHNDTLATAYEKLKYRLAKLEDKIESGTLVELPCKVGDVFYYLKDYRVVAIEIAEISYNGRSFGVYDKGGYWYHQREMYFTKEAAEAKLKELRGEV